MPINVSTTNQDIEVSTTGQTVSATVSGGQGPPGTAALPSATEGQVLTYVSGAWTAASPTGGVSTTDPRLSDAREWSASTISQAEAEAGTATTRRAFTAQRVRQAVSSWWQSIQSVTSPTFSTFTAVDGAGAGPGVEIAGDGITFNDSTIQSTAFTAAAKTKLDGIQSGATANATDAQLRDRSTHTGTQAWSTITSTPTTRSGYGITDAQAASPYLDQFVAASAAIDGGATSFVYWYDNSSASVSTSTVTAFGRSLIDDASASVARTTLGLGTLATQSSVAYSSLTGTPSTFSPSAHKSSHATGGADALTASDIGAAAVSHIHSAEDLTSGTVATARLGSGTASASNFLRGDGTWSAAGSTSASDLTSGTLADARLSANARQAIDNLLHPFLLAGM